MLNPFKRNSPVTIALLDVFFGLMVTMVLSLGILMIWVNDPKKESSENAVEPIGSMMVEMFWPDDVHVDMDLWVQAPNDSPVGFSRKTGTQFDLLRDDLGRFNDLANRNYEIQIGKDIVTGTYRINVKWYPTAQSNNREDGNVGGNTEKLQSYNQAIEVRVVVTLTIQGQPSTQIIARTVTVNPTQEINVFNFDINDNFKLDPDSVYFNQRLRLSSPGEMTP